MNQIFGATNLLNYIGLAKLDMLAHETSPQEVDLNKLEEFYKQYALSSMPQGTGRVASFSHIWGGGYAVGYYSYLWAEVLDADCYSKFKENGVINPELAQKFRKEILAQGSIRDEAESFRTFMGRDPDITAYLKRAGLLT